MIRWAELGAFFAPLLALILWRVAVARGENGPPPRQLALILAGLVALGLGLGIQAVHERLKPGRYIPAHMENGQLVPGRIE